MLQTVTSQRDQVIKELEEANKLIENLEVKVTDNDAEIARLLEKQD